MCFHPNVNFSICCIFCFVFHPVCYNKFTSKKKQEGDKMMIYIVRHVETQWNADGRIQ